MNNRAALLLKSLAGIVAGRVGIFALFTACPNHLHRATSIIRACSNFCCNAENA